MSQPLSRRSFLAAGAGAIALAACSSGSKKGAQSSSSSSARTSSAEPPYALAQIYATEALVPGAPQRLAYALLNSDGSLVDSPPATLSFAITDGNGKAIGAPVAATFRKDGLPRGYYAVTFTPPAAGVYIAQTTVNGSAVKDTFQLNGTSQVLQPGQAMIPFDTPTAASPQGVELLCTHNPVCPLHDVTLTQALAAKRPLAFLVATPAYCQVGICGPVLDVLLAAADKHPEVKFLHSEVYPTKAAAQAPTVDSLMPVLKAYHLTYEPALFLAKPDGTLAQRVDLIFDATELDEALTRLVG